MYEYEIRKGEKELYGLVNKDNGHVLLPFVFKQIEIHGSILWLKRKDKWAIWSIEEAEQILHKKENDEFWQRPKYLFFDTETTGVPENYKALASDIDNWPRLVQLAWVLVDDMGNELALSNDIIRPYGFIIPREATGVHGITTEYALAKGKGLYNTLIRFIDATMSADYIVGHNITYDIKVLQAELIGAKFNFSIENKPSICTMMNSVQYCAIPSFRSYGEKYKWPKLQELHNKLFGYNFAAAHDAMADIRATKRCFFAMSDRGIIQVKEY